MRSFTRRSTRRPCTSATCCALLGWLALFAGVLDELRVRAVQRADAAVLGERRRLARELHDGVAQELAFIRRRAGRLAELPEGVEILSAAERGLEDSRRAIEALAPAAHEPLHVALERYGARLALDAASRCRSTRCATGPREVRAELLRTSPRPSATPPTTAARHARRPRRPAAERARDGRRLRPGHRREQRLRRRGLRIDRHARTGRMVGGRLSSSRRPARAPCRWCCHSAGAGSRRR
jgi:hypothetical protein